MDAFKYKNDQLCVEDIPLEELAEEYGTPLYVYSRNHMCEQFKKLKAALEEVQPLICYSIKCNSNLAVIKTFADMGAGVDVVSGGEIFRARKAGVNPHKIVFAGVGKTIAEIDEALKENIHFFTVESEPELQRISERAQQLGLIGRIAMRVNPDVDPQTHKYTSTGKKESKFGVDLTRAANAYDFAASLPGLEIAGIHMHIGSPIMSIEPYAQALAKIVPLCKELKARYSTFRYLDIGGGLGIKYSDKQQHFDLEAFAAALVPTMKELNLEVRLEPGRFLVGNAGVLITRVQYVKDNPLKKFIVIDAGMNDLIRPALYGAYHDIKPVKKTDKTVFGDLVGPVCESGDFLAFERDLPEVKQGELVAVCGAGAYSFSMSSNYNSRPRPTEIMVANGDHKLIRTRETREDLINGEIIPQW